MGRIAVTGGSVSGVKILSGGAGFGGKLRGVSVGVANLGLGVSWEESVVAMYRFLTGAADCV